MVFLRIEFALKSPPTYTDSYHAVIAVALMNQSLCFYTGALWTSTEDKTGW